MSESDDTVYTVDTVGEPREESGDKIDGNTRHRSWDFVLNNPIEGDKELIESMRAIEYAFQLEIGKKNGTPHFQGFWRFKNGKTRNSISKVFNKRISIRPVRNIWATRTYCTKEDTRADGPWVYNLGPTVKPATKKPKTIKDPLEGKELYEWQEQVLNIIDEEPEDRKIWWFWESTGNVGKTSLAKHIVINWPRTLYVCGSANHIKYGIVNMKKVPRIVIWDIARSQRIDYVALEEVKNGLFFSTKYESGMFVYNVPHVIVFSNHPPVTDKVSLDRWEIIEIGGGSAPAVA